jgi:hypothetical protein
VRRFIGYTKVNHWFKNDKLYSSDDYKYQYYTPGLLAKIVGNIRKVAE